MAYPGIYQIAIERNRGELLTAHKGVIGDGGNSGFGAINLVVQFGPPRKIILVGFDMSLAGGVHWHGKHPRGMNNPSQSNFDRWCKVLDGIAAKLTDLGVTVINCSPVSALTAYPKMTIAEALEC